MPSYLNGIIEIAESELKRMIKTVFSFADVFMKKVFRSMATIARRMTGMGGFFPALILILHDMTIDARSGIITEVGVAVGIKKGEESCPQKGGEHSRNDDKNNVKMFHSLRLAQTLRFKKNFCDKRLSTPHRLP